jgi:hypothetical protein
VFTLLLACDSLTQSLDREAPSPPSPLTGANVSLQPKTRVELSDYRRYVRLSNGAEWLQSLLFKLLRHLADMPEYCVKLICLCSLIIIIYCNINNGTVKYISLQVGSQIKYFVLKYSFLSKYLYIFFLCSIWQDYFSLIYLIFLLRSSYIYFPICVSVL